MRTKKTKLGGKRITREEAYDGLGDPSTWIADKNHIDREFSGTPILGLCKCHSKKETCPIHGHKIG